MKISNVNNVNSSCSDVRLLRTKKLTGFLTTTHSHNSFVSFCSFDLNLIYFQCRINMSYASNSPTTVNMQYHHQQSWGNDAFFQSNHQYGMQMAQPQQAILTTNMQFGQYYQYNAQCHASTRNSSRDSSLSPSASCSIHV